MRRNRGLIGLLLVIAAAAQGELPEAIVYEGYLGPSDKPYTGWALVELRLYTNASGTTPVFAVTNQVFVSDDYFSTVIQKRTTRGELIKALESGETYVETVLNGEVRGERTLLVPMAYALKAGGVLRGSVSGEMLATGSVRREHLADGAVSSRHVEQEAISGWHIQSGSVGLNDLAVEELDQRYVKRSGDECEGPLTNRAGFYGNAIGLTNFSPSALHAATSFVLRTGGWITGRLRIGNEYAANLYIWTSPRSDDSTARARLTFITRGRGGREYGWWVQAMSVGEGYNSYPNAWEVWECVPDGTPGYSMPRLRILSSDNETNVPAEVIIDGQGNMGLGCLPGEARLQVSGRVAAHGFWGDGRGLTNLSAEALNAATSFVRLGGGSVKGTLRVESNLVVLGNTTLQCVLPQGGISMGIYTNR